jgi:hypothetical protein
MPTVLVTWSGRCPDAASREALCGCLEQLAAISQSLYDSPPPIKKFDAAIEGTILMSGSVFGSPPQGAGVNPAGEDPAGENLFSIEGASLFGIEFLLFDPRSTIPQVFPSEGRVSFVFLRHENPELDGLVVQVEDRQRCQLYLSDDIKRADWYLKLPEIDLPYYLELSMNDLLGWVKHFYIPSLHFWAWREDPGYEQFADVDPRDHSYRDLFFADLLERFKAEIKEMPDVFLLRPLSFADDESEAEDRKPKFFLAIRRRQSDEGDGDDKGHDDDEHDADAEDKDEDKEIDS